MIKRADISGQKLLGDLTAAELDVIAGKMTMESYAKGGDIFREGEATKGICLIKRGKVEISKVTPDGWKQTLAVLAEQQFFGELAVIEGRKAHSTNATALDSTELYRISTDDFRQLEQAEPALMYKIMKAMARMASRNILSMNEKLMKMLISY
jgi:CRP-like cAMP-binding protein